MFKRKLPPSYRTRDATISAWLVAGHDESAVLRLLDVMRDAFGWVGTDALRIRPDDQVWAIYRESYPDRGWIGSRPDELELETLVEQLSPEIPDIQRRLEEKQTITAGELAHLLAAAGRAHE